MVPIERETCEVICSVLSKVQIETKISEWYVSLGMWSYYMTDSTTSMVLIPMATYNIQKLKNIILPVFQDTLWLSVLQWLTTKFQMCVFVSDR